MNLKMRIILFEKAVAVQILEQTEEWISFKSFAIKNFHGPDNFSVSSSVNPALGADDICLRGERKDTYDNVCVKYFESNKARDKYVTRMKMALNYWSDSITPDTKRDAQSDIFEV